METLLESYPPERHIFVACQNLIYFGFLEFLLNQENIFISGRCNTPRRAAILCDPIAIDVVVLDMAFADGLIQKFLVKSPALRIIGVTRDFEKPVIQTMKLRKMHGYIYMSPLNIQRTIDCITRVTRDELFFRF